MRLREHIAPSVAGFVAMAGSAIDLWSHELTLEGKAIMAKRAVLENVPVIGGFLADNTGNIGRSVIPMAITTLAAARMRYKAEETGNKRWETAANLTEFSGLLAIVGLNLVAETFKHGQLFLARNTQFIPDLVTGVGVMLLGHYALTHAIKLWNNQRTASP